LYCITQLEDFPNPQMVWTTL